MMSRQEKKKKSKPLVSRHPCFGPAFTGDTAELRKRRVLASPRSPWTRNSAAEPCEVACLSSTEVAANRLVSPVYLQLSKPR